MLYFTRACELAEEGVVLIRAAPVGESGGLDHKAVRIGVCFGCGDDGMHFWIPQEIGAILPLEGVVATAINTRDIHCCPNKRVVKVT